MKKLTLVFSALLLVCALTLTGCVLVIPKNDNAETKAAATSAETPADSSAPAATTVPETTVAPAVTTAPETTVAPEATSAPAENLYTYDHLTMVLPEGFTLSEVSGNPIALCPGYPTRTDNIAFSKSVADNIGNYTKDLLDSIYSQTFAGFGGSDIFEKTVIGGKDALKYRVVLTQTGITMNILQVMIFGSTYTDCITFTSVSGDFDSAFEAMIGTISVNN